jgi:hypothetical protein
MTKHRKAQSDFVIMRRMMQRAKIVFHEVDLWEPTMERPPYPKGSRGLTVEDSMNSTLRFWSDGSLREIIAWE